MQDESAGVCGQAAATLCHLAAQSGRFQVAEVAELVAPLLSSPNPRIVDATSEGMSLLGPCAAPFALGCLEADSRLQRHAAVRILAGLGACGVQVAGRMLKHQSQEVRRAALRVLQKGGLEILSTLPDAAERLGARLEDNSSRVRGVAALALASLGPKVAEAFAGQLSKQLRRGAWGELDAAELRELLEAIKRLGPAARWAAEPVADLFLVSAWSVRRSAAVAYGQICGSLPCAGTRSNANSDSEAEAEAGAASSLQTAALRLSKMLEECRAMIPRTCDLGIDYMRLGLQDQLLMTPSL